MSRCQLPSNCHVLESALPPKNWGKFANFLIYNSPFLHFVRKPDLDYVYNSVGKNCPDFI